MDSFHARSEEPGGSEGNGERSRAEIHSDRSGHDKRLHSIRALRIGRQANPAPVVCLSAYINALMAKQYDVHLEVAVQLPSQSFSPSMKDFQVFGVLMLASHESVGEYAQTILGGLRNEDEDTALRGGSKRARLRDNGRA